MSGTTSACAENTPINYLRVRGEYPFREFLRSSTLELPPRARRIRDTNVGRGDYCGTTSACAENTSSLSSALVGGRNYLRARGEYETAIIRIEPVQELPPRTRRIPTVTTRM